MDFNQMAAAIGALGEFAIRYRAHSTQIPWYVSHASLELKSGRILSSIMGGGSSPEAAVIDYWERLTHLKSGDYLVLRATSKDRRAVRWNGFMWADVQEESE